MKTLHTLCSRCTLPMTCYWPNVLTFGGKEVTPEVYMAKALQSKSVLIVCDECLSKMPDVKVSELILYNPPHQTKGK